MPLLEDLLSEYDPPLTGDSDADAQAQRFGAYITDAEGKVSSISPPLPAPVKPEAMLAWCKHRIFARAYNYFIGLPEKTQMEMAGSTDLGSITARLNHLKGERDRALSAYEQLVNPAEEAAPVERRESGYLPVKFNF